MRALLFGAVVAVLASGCQPPALVEQCVSSCEETACGEAVACNDLCEALDDASEDLGCVPQMQAQYDCFDAAVDAAEEVCTEDGAIVYSECADEVSAFYDCLGQQ